MKSRRIVIEKFGRPESVATLQLGDIPDPAHGEVCIRTRFAPVNPADLNIMEGTYGTLPVIPAVIGNESVGIVEHCGAGVTEFGVGDVVMPMLGLGHWAELVNVPQESLVKLPKEISLPQAAMLRVNPATAWLLLTNLTTLQPGDWIVQNASNSAVGIAVLQLARSQGWHVLNLVRREGAAAVCTAAGADHVLLESDPNFKEQARQMLQGNRPRLALNAVGGESALRLASLLDDGGHHITFGAMSRQKLSIPNRFLIFNNLTFSGFWLSKWMQRATREAIQSLYQMLASKMADKELVMPVEKIYPVEEISTALVHAQQAERSGKILIHW